MSDLILYLVMAAIGFFIGSKNRDKKDKLGWTGKVQTVAITLLVVAMGSRMGANDEVIANLSSIGLYAFIITIVVIAFCILGINIVRKLMGINEKGVMVGRGAKAGANAGATAGATNSSSAAHADSSEAASTAGAGNAGSAEALTNPDEIKGHGIDKMTIIIVIAVFLGMAFGYFCVDKVFSSFETFDHMAGLGINIGLCVLLGFVGLDLGLDETVGPNFRKVGARVLIFPIVTAICSLIAVLVCGIFMKGLSIREMLAIGAGFGWYSLAPGIIMEKGYVTASAISFMHNVMRELFSILLIPTVAKHIGYIETTGMPGAAAMDVCLPIVEKATSSNIAIYSFVSGLFLSAAVPILVPIIV